MRSAFVLLSILGIVAPAWAQTAVGTIQGTVLSADGKPVPRATLYYGRTGRGRGNIAANVLPPVLSEKTGPDGKFTLANLPAGSWTVCVVADGHLDPCHWSAAAVSSHNLRAGEAIPNVSIRLEQSYSLQIRVNDPQGLLASEGKAAGGTLQVGVHAPSGAFQRGLLTSKDAKSRIYTLTVPVKGAARVFVSGGAFQLNDETGQPVGKGGKVSQFDASAPGNSGQAGPPSFVYTVTSLGKP